MRKRERRMAGICAVAMIGIGVGAWSVRAWAQEKMQAAGQTATREAKATTHIEAEHELAHKIFRFGNVATVFSSYEFKLCSDGEVKGRGVNIYQVYYAGGRWWISSVSWDAENLMNQIPGELLPGK